MLAICDHCGHRNDVPDSAENIEVLCQKCGQPFFALTPEEIAADHRGTKLVLAAVLIVLALMFLLLLSRSGSGIVKTAQRALVGSALSGKLGDDGDGAGRSDATGNSADSSEAGDNANGQPTRGASRNAG